MKLILCDKNSEVLAAWREQFAETPDAEIRDENILETAARALVIPGNGLGFLDSGLELRVTEVFGFEVQDDIRKRIAEEYDGELLVGQALAMELPDRQQALVYAPIWRVPQSLEDTVNIFLAARGAFLALKKAAIPVEEVAFPSMGVDPGGLHPLISARQIRYAYEILTGDRGRADKNLSQAQRRDMKLRVVPGSARRSP